MTGNRAAHHQRQKLNQEACTGCATGALSLRELAVGLAEALDEDAHEGLVEADLAGGRRDAKRAGLDLHDGDARLGGDGGGAALDLLGEVEDFAEHAAGFEDGEGLAEERDFAFALDEDVKAIALLVLAHEHGAGIDGEP